MRVAIQRRLQPRLRKQVADGRFESVAEAVNALLSAQLTSQELSRKDIAELRREIALGLDDLENGRAAPWDPQEIWAEVERISQKRSKKAG